MKENNDSKLEETKAREISQEHVIKKCKLEELNVNRKPEDTKNKMNAFVSK